MQDQESGNRGRARDLEQLDALCSYTCQLPYTLCARQYIVWRMPPPPYLARTQACSWAIFAGPGPPGGPVPPQTLHPRTTTSATLLLTPAPRSVPQPWLRNPLVSRGPLPPQKNRSAPVREMTRAVQKRRADVRRRAIRGGEALRVFGEVVERGGKCGAGGEEVRG